MNQALAVWLMFRALRWLSWIVFFGFSIVFLWDKSPWINTFGHLLRSTEAIFFGAGLFGTFCGFMELMMREKAGIQRPAFGQLIPPKVESLARNSN
jgi:hypothetical protein